MNQQPDKFFRDKLETYERAAPASAWDRIAAGQNKKKRKAIWLKIAASLLPFAVAGYFLWPMHQRQSDIIASTEKPAITSSTDSTQSNVGVPNISVPHDTSARREPATQHDRRNVSGIKPSQKSSRYRVARQAPATNQLAAVNESGQKESTLSTDINQHSITVVTAPTTPGNTKKNVKLVFSASDVEQYLDKDSEEYATSDEKKSSTLQKLLKKAGDLGAQDPLGELRQKKNEILALNFKSKGNGDKSNKQ